jgi:predicted dehydrogenase
MKTPSSKALSRRRFIRVSAATGIAAMGAPYILRAGAGERLNTAFIGLGGQGTSRLREIMNCRANVVALCDLDDKQLQAAKRVLANRELQPVLYSDYRELLEKQKDIDSVVIATPDHWHAIITKAVLEARKHLFCEKPLTHTISEAREIRKLAQSSKVITQMGNQGSASREMRRSIEVIQAGAIGKVKEVHTWVFGAGCHPGLAMPTEGDPVPEGFRWDGWLGPAPKRLYKKDYYHPWNWRGWYDFGNGVVADFGCHNLNLPYRSLHLDYPTHIEAEGEFMGLPTYPGKTRFKFDFAARKDLPAMTISWYDGGRMPAAGVIPESLVQYRGETPKEGVLTLGENGFIFGDPWKGGEYIKLKDEAKLSGILQHAATKEVAQSLPRTPGHLQEWVDACLGGPATFSDFEVGGKLTEIALSGVIAAKVGKPIEWDGEKMIAKNAPEDDKFVKAEYRTDWKI